MGEIRYAEMRKKLEFEKSPDMTKEKMGEVTEAPILLFMALI